MPYLDLFGLPYTPNQEKVLNDYFNVLKDNGYTFGNVNTLSRHEGGVTNHVCILNTKIQLISNKIIVDGHRTSHCTISKEKLDEFDSGLKFKEFADEHIWIAETKTAQTIDFNERGISAGKYVTQKLGYVVSQTINNPLRVEYNKNEGNYSLRFIVDFKNKEMRLLRESESEIECNVFIYEDVDLLESKDILKELSFFPGPNYKKEPK